MNRLSLSDFDFQVVGIELFRSLLDLEFHSLGHTIICRDSDRGGSGFQRNNLIVLHSGNRFIPHTYRNFTHISRFGNCGVFGIH